VIVAFIVCLWVSAVALAWRVCRCPFISLGNDAGKD